MIKGSNGPLLFALSGLMAIVIGTGVFSLVLFSTPIATPGRTIALIPIAEGFLLVVAAGLVSILVGARNFLRLRRGEIYADGAARLSPGWIIPYLMSLRRYRRFFVFSTLLYGIFYAFITSMIVYQPSVDFAAAYGASFPSATVTPIASPPLFTPVLTVYLTNHVGILLIPLTVLLAVTISVLVGLNFALAAFAFDSRTKGGNGWLGGVGAAVGLFTGCPTCAGLFFANFLGGTGAVSFATLLGYYQPAFILLSLPVLAGTPYLISNSLAKVYRDGCVYLKSSGA